MNYLTPGAANEWIAAHPRWINYAAQVHAEFAYAFRSSDYYERAIDNWMVGLDEFLHEAFSSLILPMVARMCAHTETSDYGHDLVDAAAELASLVASAMAEATMDEICTPGWLNLQHNMKLIDAAAFVERLVLASAEPPRWEVTYTDPLITVAPKKHTNVIGSTVGEALSRLQDRGIRVSNVVSIRRSFMEQSFWIQSV